MRFFFLRMTSRPQTLPYRSHRLFFFFSNAQVHGYPLYRRKPPPPTPIPPSRGSRRHRSRNGASSSSSSSSNPLLENTGADSATASTTTGGQGTHSSSSSSSTSSSRSNGAAWAAAANDGKAVRKDYVYKCSLNGARVLVVCMFSVLKASFPTFSFHLVRTYLFIHFLFL